MQAILAVTIPFFALVLAGYLAAWRRILPEAAIPGLNAFVLYFALPCLLFRFGMNTPVLQLLNPAVLGVYLVCALAIVGFTVAVTLDEAVPLKDAAFGALVAQPKNANAAAKRAARAGLNRGDQARDLAGADIEHADDMLAAVLLLCLVARHACTRLMTRCPARSRILRAACQGGSPSDRGRGNRAWCGPQ